MINTWIFDGSGGGLGCADRTVVKKMEYRRTDMVTRSLLITSSHKSIVTIQHNLGRAVNTKAQRHQGTKKAGAQSSFDAGFLCALVPLCLLLSMGMLNSYKASRPNEQKGTEHKKHKKRKRAVPPLGHSIDGE